MQATRNNDLSIHDPISIQPNGGNVGIGVTAPGEKLEVAGKTKTTTFQMTTGAFNGYALISDVSGNGTWTALNIPTNTNQLTNGSGYITDGNSGWDNSYGYISDGNIGWHNSYGFITSGGDNISIEGVAVIDPNLIGNNTISIANTTGSTYQFNLNSGTVAENHLDVSNSPTNAYALKWNSSLSKLEWQADNTGSGMVYPGAGIALSAGSSWAGSITNNSASWNTAYTERATWDGGTSGLVAATARTSLSLIPNTLSGTTTNSASAGYHTHALSFYGSGSGPSFLGYDATYGIAWKTAGSSGQVVYNNGTALTGSTALTSNGTNVTSTGTFTGTNFILSSDRRLKKNIQPIGDMSWVDDIHFKSFYMNNDLTATMRYGVIAQELEIVNPGLVSTGDNGYKAVSYIDLLIAKVARQDEILNKLIK